MILALCVIDTFFLIKYVYELGLLDSDFVAFAGGTHYKGMRVLHGRVGRYAAGRAPLVGCTNSLSMSAICNPQGVDAYFHAFRGNNPPAKFAAPARGAIVAGGGMRVSHQCRGGMQEIGGELGGELGGVYRPENG
jgi:hypothetical protein